MIGHVGPAVDGSKTRTLVVRVFLLLAVALIVDLLAAGILGARATKQAADRMDRALKALAADDVGGFESGLFDAAVAAHRARLYMNDPGLVLARSVPGVTADAHALTALAETATSGVAAGVAILEGLDRIDARDGVASAAFHDGAFDVGVVAELGRTSASARAHLDAAGVRLSALERPLLSPLRSALARAKARVERARSTAVLAGSFAELLPGFAGDAGDRNYLLAFQSPSEARGGGGLIGVYGLLSARGGRMTLEEIGPIEDLGPRVRPAVSAPPSFARSYGPLSALNDFRQVNLSPDFPTTAEVLLRLYQQVRGDRLDGVIAMDPLALGEMTRATGPLTAAGWGKAITPRSARRALLFDIYRRFVHREREQNAYLRGLVDELWSRMASGDVDLVKLIAALQESTRKQHLKIYSTEPSEQLLLGELGATGEVGSGAGLVHMAFNNNNSGNKVDFFLRREQDISIRLEDDGTARVDVVMSLINDVPERGLRAIGRSGVASGLERGENRMSLHFLVPKDAQDVVMTIDGSSRTPFRGEDSGGATAWRVLAIPPNEDAVVEVSYSVPDAVRPVGERREFSLLLWSQATARPDLVSLEIFPPAGRAFGEGRGGELTPDGVFEWSDRLRQPRTFRVTF